MFANRPFLPLTDIGDSLRVPESVVEPPVRGLGIPSLFPASAGFPSFARQFNSFRRNG